MGQIFAPWWNELPSVAAIAGGLGPNLAFGHDTLHAGLSGLDRPSASCQPDTILKPRAAGTPADLTPEDVK